MVSDIAAMVRDALYEPVRSLQLATHFKKVKDDTNQLDFCYQPCSPNDNQAIEMSLMDIKDGNRLKPLDLNIHHFANALKNTKHSVGQDDLQRFDQWTSELVWKEVKRPKIT